MSTDRLAVICTACEHSKFSETLGLAAQQPVKATGKPMTPARQKEPPDKSDVLKTDHKKWPSPAQAVCTVFI